MLRIQKTLFLMWLVVIVAGLSSCKKDDDGPAPTTAKIKGNITLLNTEVWAAYQDSGEVQLTIFPEFSLNPPAGWGPIPDNTFGPGVPGGTFAIGAPANAQNPLVYNYQAGANIGTYELEVDPGTYSALALGFRHDLVTDPSLRTATLGVHWGNATSVSHGIVIRVPAGPNIITVFNEPAPSSITVEAGDELTIDFTADFGFIEDWYMR
ncbi:MAG: hypothetical protein IPL46_03640 [Saprospiraceae bacterium]|nr:hypothetical protein [Saprospiraceae bacterium]